MEAVEQGIVIASGRLASLVGGGDPTWEDGIKAATGIWAGTDGVNN